MATSGDFLMATDTYSDGKVLVGYVHFEYAPRPHLFWVDAGRWELEDLNLNDEWTWG